MLHNLAALPALPLLRAPADGSSGTLGVAVVGTYELRPGAVTPDRLAQLPAGTVLGRAAEGGDGAPSALDAGALRRLVDAGGPAMTLACVADAETARIGSGVATLSLEGASVAGDGGGALWVRSAVEGEGPGRLRTADGAWWRLASRPLSPCMFRRFIGDHDRAWSDMGRYIEEEYQGGRWRCGFNIAPDIIDGRGATYVLTSDVTIPAGCQLHNMKIDSRRATLTLGDAAGERTHRFALSSVDMNYVGWANLPAAMLNIPSCSHTVIDATCTFNGGTGVERARYGVYIGRHTAFGLSVSGSYRGGDCAIRIGRERDQTSLDFSPTIVARGRKYNAIICNPKGARIKGDFEHADGTVALAITSCTNGSSSTAEAVEISCGYAFNNSNGAASPIGNRAILIGHDLPGTEGWDVEGQVITSVGTKAKMIHIHDMYLVSDHVETCIDVIAQFGVDIERIVWGGGYANQALARFAGPCNETRLRTCRNQNTGKTRPRYLSTAGNRILYSEAEATWTPTLYGATQAGTLAVSAAAGVRGVRDGEGRVTGSIEWSARTGGTGALRLGLPLGFAPAEGVTVPVQIAAGGFAGAVTGRVAPGSAFATLHDAAGTELTWANLPAAGRIHFTISMPVDMKEV